MNQDPVPAPPRMARLKRDRRGWLIPWFVAYVNGEPDFRVTDARKVDVAIKEHRCWLCGQKLGAHKAFVIGPMCAVNRVSSEPPSHRECAIYAAQACPFLTQPDRPRREKGLPGEAQPMAGSGLKRNPGVALVWVTRRYYLDQIRRKDFAPGGPPIQEGLLFNVGEPEQVLWFCEGRPATRAEVLHSMLTGLPALREPARLEGDAAMRALDKAFARALDLVPPAVEEAALA